MRKTIQIRLLNISLIILVGFGVFALYMSYTTQTTHEEEVAATAEEYDYEDIQEMVSLPQKAEYTPPYDIEEMRSINEDFKGWLWIPDTVVNYPVVQTDNNSTYLTTSFQGEYSSYGSLFLDKDSTSGSRNRVIHGHNMGSTRTEMFSTLVNYQDPTWAGERSIAYFTEPDTMKDSQYRLFAVLNFDINDLDTFNYMTTSFENDESVRSFIDYLKEHSLYETEFYPERDTLILSTCNRTYGQDNRLLICFGRITDKPKSAVKETAIS